VKWQARETSARSARNIFRRAQLHHVVTRAGPSVSLAWPALQPRAGPRIEQPAIARFALRWTALTRVHARLANVLSLSRVWCVWAPSSRMVHPRSVGAGLLALLAFGSALPACSGSALTDSCGVVGRERSCECTGASIGIQVCQFDGNWEPCTCYSVAGSGGAAGSSGAAGTVGAAGSAGTSSRSSAVEASRAGRGGSRSSGFPFSSSAGRAARRD
jgi:hypothetical protein